VVKMLSLILGYMGSGKTLLLTAIAKMSNKQIISNYHLNIPYKPFSIYDFVNGKYNDCLVLIDEAYVFLESRISGSIRNRYMSYMLFQSRKKTIEIIMSMQLMNTVDLRYRELADVIVICNGMNKKGFKYQVINRISQRMISLTMSHEKAETIYPLFDTNEVVEVERSANESSQLLTPTEQKDLVKKIADAIIKKYSADTKITANVIKDYMFTHDYPANLEKFVYAKVKVWQTKGAKVCD